MEMQEREPGRQPETSEIVRQDLVHKLNALLEGNQLEEALPILQSQIVQNPRVGRA